ncbi:hypothetical protein PV762_02315 [Mitsuaria sp. CC2]|uniref:hypothetical protein n=1 Tax=Mitsuaria sp. CC2 TaxID=3029186 RepID=UPI003B8EA055
MPAQAALAASGPQIIASQPIPVDITTTKALTIEIAKVPDGKPFDPHWTTYVQAIGTPVVAVIAAAIAATIQYRQWRTATASAETAKNKLKLDLFDKRFKAFNAAAKLIVKMQTEDVHSDKEVQKLIGELAGSEFMFDEAIQTYIVDELFKHVAKVMSLQHAMMQAIKKGDGSFDGLSDEQETAKRWFDNQLDVLREKMTPFLHLTH